MTNEPLKECQLKIVDDPASKFGKRLVAECETKESARGLADLLEDEVIIRVTPGKVTEQVPEPVTEPPQSS